MGQKVTEQVAEMRSLPAGIDQRSPARHPDWLGPDDLSLKIQEIREATDYQIPIQLKLGAARVYDDVRMAAKCGPDIIYLDGAEGGTGAGPHIATEETGIPLMAAIPEARRALEDVGLADEIDLVVAGGIRNGGDVAKCARARRQGGRDRPLGADGAELQQGDPGRHRLRGHDRRARRASATTATPAAARSGITTQDPELRKRLVVDEAAERVYNFLHTLTLEVQMLARACGKTNIHSLEPEDLCALTVEAAAMAKVPLAGTNYIPGVTEERALAEIKRLLEQHIDYPVDYLPEPSRPSYAGARGLMTHAASPRRSRAIDAEYLSGRALPVPGGHRPGRGRRPAGRHAGRGHQLARGRRAARGGRRPGRLRPLLELVPQDLLRRSRRAARTRSPARC